LKLVEVDGFKFELSFVTLMLAWATSEVIRYSFFAFKVRPWLE
jgi:hypothetical protein